MTTKLPTTYILLLKLLAQHPSNEQQLNIKLCKPKLAGILDNSPVCHWLVVLKLKLTCFFTLSFDTFLLHIVITKMLAVAAYTNNQRTVVGCKKSVRGSKWWGKILHRPHGVVVISALKGIWQ